MKILFVIAIVFIGLVLLAKPLGAREKERKARLIAERFGERKTLDPQDFYETYFSSQGYSQSAVLGIREIMEKVLDTDLSFLKDSDDFSKNLSFFWDFDSMANVELVQAIEERFGIRISDEEAEATKTVRQLVDLVQTKTRKA